MTLSYFHHQHHQHYLQVPNGHKARTPGLSSDNQFLLCFSSKKIHLVNSDHHFISYWKDKSHDIAFASTKTFVYWSDQAGVDVQAPMRPWQMTVSYTLRMPHLTVQGQETKGHRLAWIENRGLFRMWSNTYRTNMTLLFSWEPRKLPTISLVIVFGTSHVFLEMSALEGWWMDYPIWCLGLSF